MRIDWEVAGHSDVGRVREGNEDSFRIDSEAGIFIVADGMGGHAAGDVASRVAADVALNGLLERTDDVAGALTTVFASARNALIECAERDPRRAGMGTTLTVAALAADGRLDIGHIGDSRAYRFRDGYLAQLTRDHTWVQREVDAGNIDPEDAHGHPLSHILTRVLTDDQPGAPDIFSLDTRPGDWIILSTDGLHNLIEDRIMTATIEGSSDPADLAKRLIERANRAGGTDNITAVVVRLTERENA